MKIIIGILASAILGVVTNLVSGFLAPKAKKYKKWIWAVFAALIGFLIVLAYPFTNKEAKHDKNVGITAGRDVNAPGGVLHTGQGNVYVTNPTIPETVAKCPDVDVWMPPVEAINAFVPEGHDFYELIKRLENLGKSSIELDNQINENPNSPELDTWKKRQYDIHGEISKEREKRFRTQVPVLEKLVEQLKNSTLVAKGYDRYKREVSCISMDLWQSLGFELNEGKFNKADGPEMHYTGVQIGKPKAIILQENRPSGGNK